MDVGLLKVFLAVAEEGSISKAAHKLSYVQSNVTARIQQLELELKTPLFYRHSKGVTLTSAGRTLKEYSSKILNLIHEAETAVLDSPEPKGVIAIGSDTTASVRLPAILSSYRGKFPEVDVHLEIGRQEQLIESVLHYALHGAFVDGPVEHPDLVQEIVIQERLALILPESLGPYHPGLLQNQTLLVLHEDCVYCWRLEEWLRGEGQRLHKVMPFGTMEGLLGCVKAGIGYAVLPVSYFERLNVKDGMLCYPLPERHGLVPTVFIRHRDWYMTSAYRKFLEELRLHLEVSPAAASGE